jgi:hypothetical protein
LAIKALPWWRFHERCPKLAPPKVARALLAANQHPLQHHVAKLVCNDKMKGEGGKGVLEREQKKMVLGEKRGLCFNDSGNSETLCTFFFFFF